MPEDDRVKVAPGVRVARVYDGPAPDDGARVLVDRLWPRGLAKDAAALDDWCREIGPSAELRTWFGHDPDRFEEFVVRYRDELDEPVRAAALAHLIELGKRGTLTLLTATKAVDVSHALVLARLISRRVRGS
ncbi:DUF488 domain-containing protein [Planotetraspora kaengkrachanensis]|uniref:DUF488 family protein n=1 Tax=Planotetraspora kaengkrachanensis TaxID=575193 RepID=A0A8J3V939_9ACTN|nr:DUF488 family protein [Planotetraspora kaengkrachanensis]GIG83125.1 hypothetical protein Pka01_62520 [Planotetraspora kaengkrachanensis]